GRTFRHRRRPDLLRRRRRVGLPKAPGCDIVLTGVLRPVADNAHGRARRCGPLTSFPLIREFLLRYRWRYIAGLLSLLAVNTLQLITPQVMRRFVDELPTGRLTSGAIWLYGGIIVALAALIAAGRYLWRIYVMGTARLLEYTLRNRLYAHLQTLSPRYFIEHKIGDLMAHATNDINAVRMAM